MKMNKKGFTLIEMLVVIAIIAVLVSIIIPVVGNSTTKAQAATDAANLRSTKATIQIAVMEGTIDKNVTEAEYSPALASKSGDGNLKYTVVDGVVTVYFGSSDNNIAHYANKAGGGVGSGDTSNSKHDFVAKGGDGADKDLCKTCNKTQDAGNH